MTIFKKVRKEVRTRTDYTTDTSETVTEIEYELDEPVTITQSFGNQVSVVRVIVSTVAPTVSVIGRHLDHNGEPSRRFTEIRSVPLNTAETPSESRFSNAALMQFDKDLTEEVVT
jgi:hypothetical protein